MPGRDCRAKPKTRMAVEVSNMIAPFLLACTSGNRRQYGADSVDTFILLGVNQEEKKAEQRIRKPRRSARAGITPLSAPVLLILASPRDDSSREGLLFRTTGVL